MSKPDVKDYQLSSIINPTFNGYIGSTSASYSHNPAGRLIPLVPSDGLQHSRSFNSVCASSSSNNTSDSSGSNSNSSVIVPGVSGAMTNQSPATMKAFVPPTSSLMWSNVHQPLPMNLNGIDHALGIPPNMILPTSDNANKSIRAPGGSSARPDATEKGTIDFQALCFALLRPPDTISDKVTHTALNALQDSEIIDNVTSKKDDAYFTQAAQQAPSWAVNEVVDFLKRFGFDREAELFQDQEIDGSSLLLLRRSDVLQLLGLKLGPALKIFNRINKLQRLLAVNNSQASATTQFS